MKHAWNRIYKRLRTDFTNSDARRLTNLALAGALSADDSAIILDSYQLVDFANKVSEELSVSSSLSLEAFKGLDGLQLDLDTRKLDRASLDDWVEAFQAADGSRKSLGAFSTPAPFADLLASQALIATNAVAISRVVDPSAGAGSLLISMFAALVQRGIEPNRAVAMLHGIEIDPVARELCVLHIWLSVPLPARPPLSHIASNVLPDDSISRNWWENSAPYDVVITNPPWESLRHSRANERDEGVRLETLECLEKRRLGADGLPPLYSAHGRGDRNLVKAFMELYPHLLSDQGIVSALIPAAFGSDLGMADLRRFYLNVLSIKRWTTFENQSRLFPIDSRYKFGVILAKRAEGGTKKFYVRSFCHEPHEVSGKHIAVRRAHLERVGGPQLSLPELTSKKERNVLLKMLGSEWCLLQPGPLGTVSYRREVDLTLGRQTRKFIHIDETNLSVADSSDLFAECKSVDAPLLEGRMVGQYDCFQKSYVSGAGRSAIWSLNGNKTIEECRPQFVSRGLPGIRHRIAICDVTSATNTRTVLAARVPNSWLCGNTAPVLAFTNERSMLAALVILNSLVFDWMTRRIVSGLHLNKFYLEQLRWPRLCEDNIERLSSLGRELCGLHPRGGLESSINAHKHSLQSTEIAARLGRVEAIVAKTYGLTLDEVEFMLSTNKSDRRGFWRYFKSVDHAEEVRCCALDLMDEEPPAGSRW